MYQCVGVLLCLFNCAAGHGYGDLWRGPRRPLGRWGGGQAGGAAGAVASGRLLLPTYAMGYLAMRVRVIYWDCSCWQHVWEAGAGAG